MRTVLQYFIPVIPFSDKRCLFIKLIRYGTMPDHFLNINFDANIENKLQFDTKTSYLMITYNVIESIRLKINKMKT
jgi:hypothetical protein